MNSQSNKSIYDNAINVIDKEINDYEVSTLLFVKASEQFFGDAEESMRLIESAHNVYLILRREGWEREKAMNIGIPIAVACYVKEYEDRESTKWLIIYGVLAIAAAMFISTIAPINF